MGLSSKRKESGKKIHLSIIKLELLKEEINKNLKLNLKFYHWG